MLHDLRDRKLFPRFTDEQIETLKPLGKVIETQDRAIVLREGDPEYPLFFVLSGKLRIFKRLGAAEELLAYHGPGEFAAIRLLTEEAQPLPFSRVENAAFCNWMPARCES